MTSPITYRFSLHGPAVAVANSCSSLDPWIQFFLRAFTSTSPLKTLATRGEIRPFDLTEVTRSLTQAVGSRRSSDDLVEIYSLGERSWLLDDRWGMCEINLLKHRWQSWVLPRPRLDPVFLTEAAVLWPMAQLLRLRGIELISAISVERQGWGALIVCPYAITSGIARLAKAGYRIIGQRWTALAKQHGRIVLRHLPGVVESPDAASKSIGRETTWIDLAAENPLATAQLCACDAVVVITPGRRGVSHGRVVASGESQALLRRHWPLMDLPLNRSRLQPILAALASQCLCLSAQLSRNTDEFLQLIEFARHRTASKIQVSIGSALRRHFAPPSAKRIAV